MNIICNDLNIKCDETIRHLSHIDPYKGLLNFVIQWGLIFALIVGFEYLRSTVPMIILVSIYILLAAFIASRQHALGVLLHEAVHHRLTRSRWLNDFIGEWMIAWPLHVTLYGYREQHLTHHRNIGKDHDPDQIRMDRMNQYIFPKQRNEMYIIILKYLCGYYALGEFKEIMKELVIPAPRRLHLQRCLAYIALITGLIYFNVWFEYLMYWYVPMVTFSLLFLYIRIVGEHRALHTTGHIFGTTRHVIPKWWERIFIAPNHVNYHLDHHLFPTVPFYNLHKLHQFLMNDPQYKERVHITSDGYWKGLLMKECVEYS